MLHLVLVPLALTELLPPPTAAEQASRALRPDSRFVVLTNDLEAAFDVETRGAWADFVLDQRWRDWAAKLDTAELFDDELLQALIPHLSSVRGGAFGVSDWGALGSFDGSGDPDEEPVVVFALLVPPSFVAELVEDLDLPNEPRTALVGGEPHAVFELGRGCLTQRGEVALFIATDDSFADTEGALARLSSEDRSWWLDHADRSSGAHLEVFVDLKSVEVPSNPVLAGLEVAYAGVEFGSGREGDMEVVVGIDAPLLLEPLTAAQQAPDLDLLGLVGEEDVSATLLSLDFGGLAQALLELLDELDPDGSVDAEAGLAAFDAEFGFDLLGDLLENLAGPMLVLSHPTDPEDLVSEELTPEQVPTLVFRLEVPDAFRDFLLALEGSAANVGLELETEESEEATSVTMRGAAMDMPELGDITAVVEGSLLAIGNVGQVAAVLRRARAGATAADCPLGDDLPALLGDSLEGGSVTVADLGESIDLFAEIVQIVVQLEPDAQEEPELAEAFSSFGETLAIVAGEHLRGVVAYELAFREGGVAVRYFTR